MNAFRIALAALVLLTLSLTATAQDSATLTVLVEQGSLWLQEAAAKQFEAEPGHTVEFVNVPYGSVFDRLSAQMATGGAAFDVATIDVWMSHFAPIAEALDALFTDEVIEDLFASLVADAQIGGAFIGMPTWANTEIIFYRKDLWEDPDEMTAFEAEYGYPLAPPTTWQEFDDMAQFFTRDNDGDGEIDMYGADVRGGVADFDWMIAVLQAGSPGVVLDADHKAMGIEASLGLAARKSAYAQYAEVEGFENLNPLLQTLDSPQTIGRPAVADWQQIADEILGPIGTDALTCEEDPAELLACGRAELEAMGYE